MKKKVFCAMVLCMGLFSSCDKEDIGFEEPIVPPIEEPGEGDIPELPSTNDLIRVKIDNDIMAIVGSNAWVDIAYGNNKYVAVGYSGSIAYSTDGVNWTLISLGNTDWYSVAFGNGKFMAVGTNGYVTSSTDGVNFTTPTQPNGDRNYRSVVFGDGKFVILQEGGTYSFVSTNGTTFDNFGQIFNSSSSHSNIIGYGNGKFIAFGASNSVGCYVNTSTDGYTWKRKEDCQQLHIDDIDGIAYGNNKFVAVAGFYRITSSDGENWSTHKVCTENYDYLNRITFIDGYYIACGSDNDNKEGVIYITPDGENWVKNETNDLGVLNSLCPIIK